MPIQSPFPPLKLPECNVLSYLFSQDAELSDAPMWLDASDPSKSLSKRAAVLWAKRLALGLQRRGLRRGDTAMIYTPNHIFVPVAFYAFAALGVGFSGANPKYTVDELVHQLRTLGTSVLLVHPSVAKSGIEAATKAGIPLVNLFLFDQEETTSFLGLTDFRNIVAGPDEAATWIWEELGTEESKRQILSINFSSGTTGLPKGVCCTHYNLTTNIEQVMQMQEYEMPMRWINFLPLYHAYGQLFTMGVAAKLGVPCYIMKEFHFTTFLRHLQDYRITTLQAVPPIILMMSKRPEVQNYDISSVRYAIVGGAPLSRDILNDVSKRFNIQINQGWGMTEMTSAAINVPGRLTDDSGSVGCLQANMEAKVVDEGGNEVREGERGELLVKGPNVCLGYWKNESATKEVFDRDGFLKTGDIVVHDRRGWFWIVDRKKELIKVNGLQVAPAEVEAVILQNDDVADAAVVGMPMGDSEYPRAYIVAKDHAKASLSATEVQQWVQTRLSKHKWLRGGVMFVDELPKLASGKVVRKILKEWVKRDLSQIGNPQARL